MDVSLNSRKQLQECIFNCEQNNYNIELYNVINSQNDDFIELNNQIIKYNDLIEKIKICENKLGDVDMQILKYHKDKDILKKIDDAKNKIQEIVGGRKDYKTDCLAAEFKDWGISWE